jgi:uncharacterized protein YbcI
MEAGHPAANGSLMQDISNAVVKLTREYTGRGPTKARTHVSRDLVTVVMRDTLTKAEQTLVANGEAPLVMELRQRFQQTMSEDLIAAVEGLTGRTVLAFVSGNHIEPDMAIETFVLEPDDADLDGDETAPPQP